MTRYDSTQARAGLVPVYDVPPGVGQRFGEALITGLGAGALAGCAFRVCLFSVGDSALAGALFGSGAFVLCWLRLMAISWRTKPDAEPEATPTEPSRLVLVNAKPATPEPGEPDAGRFAEFVRACARDTTVRRLEALGFSRGEQIEYREALLKTGWAEWTGQDRRQGWRLTAEPSEVLAAMG